jgi:hypothetical protein
MSETRTIATLLTFAMLVGCASRDEGFTLPPGDAQRGRDAFVAFRCYDCHDVYKVELPPRAKSAATIITLGGDVARVKSYGDLVTGIINPSHRLATAYTPPTSSDGGQSPMKVYNDVMTVSQLVDIVTFLQQHYELLPYEPTTYPIYYPL